MTFLNGKLTYICGFAAVAWGLLGGLMGWISWTEAMPIVWSGLTALGLRRAIANS